jgi:hypothetical protein
LSREEALLSDRKNGTPTRCPVKPPDEVIVERVVISPKDAPVTATALVLSEAALKQLVIRAPLPASK